MSPLDLRAQVLAVVRERGPLSANAVVASTRSRRADVLAVLRACKEEGLVRRTPDGLAAVGTTPEPVPVARPDVTAVELARLSRPERVRRLWSAMSPAARERAWAGLSTEQRAEAVAVLFGASAVGR